MERIHAADELAWLIGNLIPRDRASVARGWGVYNPLIPVTVKPNASGALPTSKSFLSVSADNVIVTAVKKSEDSNDVTIRFYEAEGTEKSKVVITPSFGVKEAYRTNLIEEGADKMDHTAKDASMEVGKYSIETIRIVPKK